MSPKATLQNQHSDPITAKIVKKVSVLEGVDPIELHPPLQTVVDLDALEDLFSPTIDGAPREDISVKFTYCGHQVTVERDSEVHVRVTE